MLRHVDLPLPFFPSRPRTWPFGTCKFKELRATFGGDLPTEGYTLRRLYVIMRGRFDLFFDPPFILGGSGAWTSSSSSPDAAVVGIDALETGLIML